MIEMAIPFPDFIRPELFTIPQFSLGGIEIGPLALRWYALAYIGGILIGWAWMLKLADRPQLFGLSQPPLSRDDVDDFLFYATLGVLIGGRLGSVLLYHPDMLADPARILRIWEGGMSFHGGLAGVVLAVIGVAVLRKVPLMRLADMVALVAPVGLGLGRITNFINQELYGRPADVAWAVIFKSDPFGLPRHPSQLYQAFFEGVILLGVLWFVAIKLKGLMRPGLIAGLFMVLYAVLRAVAELFREPDAELIAGLTRGTVYSIPMVLLGLVFVVLALRKPPAAQSAQAATGA
jgi:phosphatidylglycerol---prolipoprotein diacylglyceryl transferase